MAFPSTTSTDDRIRAVHHLVAFLSAPPAHLWLRTLRGHVALLTAVTALGGLRALGHHVTLLLAPPALLRLRAVAGKVSLLDRAELVTGQTDRLRSSYLAAVPALVVSSSSPLLSSISTAKTIIRHDNLRYFLLPLGDN